VVSLRSALQSGRREALSQLAESLAEEIATTTNPRDRLSTVRAFLATLAQLEQLDATALRLAREDARKSASGHLSGSSSLVDELRERRARRKA
jgi:hypothetical protein